ncbi:MAG: hypothetical protein U0R44_05370 [Candidatus Micrarchaeia archaeon]
MEGSVRREFIDSVARAAEKRISQMKKAYSVDPTPALRDAIGRAEASAGRLVGELRREHERFERMMRISDHDLQRIHSDERTEPLIGDRELVGRIRRRAMGEAEYLDLIEGPTLIIKR